MENRSQDQPEEQQQLPELSLGFPLQPPSALLPHQQQVPELSLGFPLQPPPALLPHQQYQLDVLWKNHKDEVENMTDFKTHPLPVTRIRRLMKSCPEVQLVSSDAPVMISKACEMFIHDLTLRAWINAEENLSSTIEPINFYDAICHTDHYKFMIVPRDGNASRSGSTEVTSASDYPPAGEAIMPEVMVKDEEQSAAQGPTNNKQQNYF